jgi:hypothetical protein
MIYVANVLQVNIICKFIRYCNIDIKNGFWDRVRDVLTGLGSLNGGDSFKASLAIKCKSKSVPLLQAWSGPEGSRKLRLPDFMTTALESGKFVSLIHRPHLPTGNSPDTHFC